MGFIVRMLNPNLFLHTSNEKLKLIKYHQKHKILTYNIIWFLFIKTTWRKNTCLYVHECVCMYTHAHRLSVPSLLSEIRSHF